MQKKFLIFSFMMSLIFATNTYASKLLFTEKQMMNWSNIKSEKKSIKKAELVHYVNGNVLDLSNGQVQDKDMPAIIDFLKNHPNITSLNLMGNGKLTGIGLTPLAELTSLIELNLARPYKTDKDIGLTAKDIIPFVENKTLKILNLSFHSIGDEGAFALAKNTTLEKLNLTLNNITDIGGVALANNENLQELSLDSNDVGLKTAEALAKNQKITHLNLQQTDVTDDALALLATNTHLIDLNVGLTNVGNEGAIAIAKNPSLKKLSIFFNNITNKGGIALAQNHNLITLDVDGNPFDSSAPRMDDEAAVAFGQNNTLQHLGMAFQRFTAKGAVEILKNQNLKSLYLASKYIDDDAAILIAQHGQQLNELSIYGSLTDKSAPALAAMTQLKILKVWENHISDAGAAVFANNTTLQDLDLSGNNIHDEGAVALAQNQTLSHLDVMFNCIGVIGNKALENNHYIVQIDRGGTSTKCNLSPDVEANDSNAKLVTWSYAASHHGSICYSTKNLVRCAAK